MMKKLVLLLMLLGLSAGARAALIDSPDGSFFTDTSSGLDWLDLTATNSLTYNQVVNELGPGGQFEGYRFANSLEVFLLFNEAGGNGIYDGFDLAHNAWAPPFMNMWGITGFGDPPPTAFTFYFLQEDFEGQTFFGQMIIAPDLFDTEGTYVKVVQGLQNPDLQSGQIGSALVRPSVIPVPAAVWLFGTALVGLVGFARRRAQT